MAKASRPGNQAVAGIQGTSTTYPTYYSGQTKKEEWTGSSGSGSTKNGGSTKSSSSSSTKSSSSYSYKSSGSGGSGSGSGGSSSWLDMLGYNPYALSAIDQFRNTYGTNMGVGITHVMPQVEAETPLSAWNPLIDSGNYIGFGDFAKTRAPATAYDRAMSRLADQLNAEGAPRYNPSKELELDQALSNLVNREDYSYRPEDDRFWNLYKERYTDMGQKAMKDAMGQAAGLTGGYGSSYGSFVGQDAFNGYMQDLMMMLPQLEQTAYDRWVDKGDELARIFNLTNQNYKNYYDHHRDAVKDYNDNRDRVADYYQELFDQWTYGKDYALKQDQERNKVYSYWEDERHQNADRRLKADTTNANNRIAVNKANDAAIQQGWENQLNLLKMQLQYAYT